MIYDPNWLHLHIRWYLAVIHQVVAHARKLVLDPFGNYVVQYVLDLKEHDLTLGVARALRGSFAELSVQKFSSNVIEKCLNSQATEVRTRRTAQLVLLALPEAQIVVPWWAANMHSPRPPHTTRSHLTPHTTTHHTPHTSHT